MGEENDREAFISRVGTYFLLLGALLVILFIASDISRVDPGQILNSAGTLTAQVPGITQTYIVKGVEALQTRDAGAIRAKQMGEPTPTLVPIYVKTNSGTGLLDYLSFFCLGVVILGIGVLFKRKTARPAPPSQRFAGLRNLQQKQREAKAKREAAQKAKESKKK